MSTAREIESNILQGYYLISEEYKINRIKSDKQLEPYKNLKKFDSIIKKYIKKKTANISFKMWATMYKQIIKDLIKLFEEYDEDKSSSSKSSSSRSSSSKSSSSKSKKKITINDDIKPLNDDIKPLNKRTSHFNIHTYDFDKQYYKDKYLSRKKNPRFSRKSKKARKSKKRRRTRRH